MRPRVGRAFRGIFEFIVDLVQTIREVRKARREPDPCPNCGNPGTIPRADGTFQCLRCEDGYR